MTNDFSAPWSLDHGQLRNCKGEALASVPIYPGGIGGPEDLANGLLIAAAPEMLDALRASVRTLHFYRAWMAEHSPGTDYPAGIDAEDGGRNLLSRLCPGLDLWGLPLPKEDQDDE